MRGLAVMSESVLFCINYSLCRYTLTLVFYLLYAEVPTEIACAAVIGMEVIAAAAEDCYWPVLIKVSGGTGCRLLIIEAGAFTVFVIDERAPRGSCTRLVC